MDEEFPVLFDVPTPLDVTVRTSPQYWQRIVTKHPDLTDRLEDVKRTLISPTEIRRSSRDPGVLLFYMAEGEYWIVAVVRQLNGDGFLVTAYRTDAVKEGAIIWHR